MNTSPPPATLVEWMLARHAAGLPIVSRTPRRPRPRSDAAASVEGDGAGAASQRSTDRLSVAEPRFPLNIRGADDAETSRKPPLRSSTDMLCNAGAEAPRSRLDIRGAGDSETGGRPPQQSSTDMLSNARRDAPRQRLNIRDVAAAETDGNPPPRNSTDRLSIADGIALVEAARDQRLDAVFAVLADPTRRAMLAMLMRGERSVGDLAAPHAMSLAAAARHVAVLTRAGLIGRRRIGRRHLCRLHGAALTEVAVWLERFAGTGREACRDAAIRYTADMGQGRDDA